MRTALLAFVGAALYAKADDPWGLEHKDAYDVLKVPFDASREQIKQAYKARSKELHPDKLRKSDNEPFRQLRKAYDIVGFPRSKKKYDKEARKRHKHAPRRAENTLAADLAGDRKPINVVVGRLESGRALLLDEALVSRDGSHEARFEVDGNLRVREAGSRSIVWQTFAKPTRAKHGFGWLLLQHDGNLVLNSGDKGHVESVIWSSNSADPGAAKSYLELDDDGGLRVPVWKSKFYGAFVLNHCVVLHAIDGTPARWRGDAGSLPLERARTAASSAPDTLVDFHTGACIGGRRTTPTRRAPGARWAAAAASRPCATRSASFYEACSTPRR